MIISECECLIVVVSDGDVKTVPAGAVILGQISGVDPIALDQVGICKKKR